MTDLMAVDWNSIPVPEDDGAARHLVGQKIPSVRLPATDGTMIDVSRMAGRSVVYAYPMTGHPETSLPEGWDMLPGARGCTPQSCAFRDHAQDLKDLGVANIYGLSTQGTEYQREAAERLHLPFVLLSDADLVFAKAVRLPTFYVDGQVDGQVNKMTLLKRLTMIIDDGVVKQTFYPIFPPDENAEVVIAWLQQQP